jgi:hypothetical protein
MENFESNNALPTVEKVTQFIDKITEGGEILIVKERLNENGDLVELEVRLSEPDPEGNIVQFDYLVNKAGRITIDKVLFDSDGIPQGGDQIAEYKNGSWQSV